MATMVGITDQSNRSSGTNPAVMAGLWPILAITIGNGSVGWKPDQTGRVIPGAKSGAKGVLSAQRVAAGILRLARSDASNF